MYVFSFILGTCVFYIMIIMLWGVIRKHVLFSCKCAKKKEGIVKKWGLIKKKEKGIFCFFTREKGWGVLLFG